MCALQHRVSGGQPCVKMFELSPLPPDLFLNVLVSIRKTRSQVSEKVFSKYPKTIHFSYMHTKAPRFGTSKSIYFFFSRTFDSSLFLTRLFKPRFGTCFLCRFILRLPSARVFFRFNLNQVYQRHYIWPELRIVPCRFYPWKETWPLWYVM